MTTGDLVKMNLTGIEGWKDEWGIGIIIAVERQKFSSDLRAHADDIHVLWQKIGLSWEMDTMLEKV